MLPVPWQMKIAALAGGALIVLLVAACSSGGNNNDGDANGDANVAYH